MIKICMRKHKRKICFVLTSPIHYTRNLLVLKALQNRNDVELSVALGGEILLPRATSKFSNIKQLLKQQGIDKVLEAHFYLDGDQVIDKAKTLGLGIIEFSTLFSYLKPDLVVVRGDRFEVQAAAAAAVYQNIPSAHLEGGDVTGSIDETVRHAVTKLCHIHFATNELAKHRLLKMGENPKYVFNFGSPEIEALEYYLKQKPDLSVLRKSGSGQALDLGNFNIVMFHPDTSDLATLPAQVKNLYEAVTRVGVSTIWFYPNFDAGSEIISQELRRLGNLGQQNHIHFSRYLSPEIFSWLLSKTKCFIGNSSAGIKECAYLGVPVVNVGKRQNGRTKANNVKDVDFHTPALVKAIRYQMSKGRYPKDKTYYVKNTSKKIAAKLATLKLYVQKRFVD